MQQEFQQFGRVLILAGIVIIILGVFLLFGDKIPLIGKLLGDILVKKKTLPFISQLQRLSF